MPKPVVSVCIVTYQHVHFIARAVEGALMQRTDFPFEILIGEDESTDGTRELCLDFQRRHPDRIKVLLHSRRDVVLIDGLPRGGFNLRTTTAAAKGEFVALCEGDDFWTDPEKLQRQVDFLRAHQDCTGCFHDSTTVDIEGNVITPSYYQTDKTTFSQREVIGELMSAYPTCSLMYRRTGFHPLPDWFLRRPCDLYIDIHLTRNGLLGFINRNMAAYRKHDGGIWTGQRKARQVVELIIRYKLLLADSYFLEHHRELLLQKIAEFEELLFTREDFDKELVRATETVAEQTRYIAKQTEHVEELTAIGKEAQKHIDQLLAQLNHLANVSKEQLEYIRLLKLEHERLLKVERELRHARSPEGGLDAYKQGT